MKDDVIISGDFIRDIFEITKVQTENNVQLHLEKYKDLRL